MPTVKSERRRFTCHAPRACSHGGGGPQEGEVPRPPEVSKTWRSHATSQSVKSQNVIFANYNGIKRKGVPRDLNTSVKNRELDEKSQT